MAGTVLVFAEHRDGTLRKSAVEALGAGCRLARALGGEAAALLVGDGVAGLAAAAGRAGAARVLLCEAPHLARYTGDGYAQAVAAAAARLDPAAVLFPASATGVDLAPRAAALLDAGMASDCTALKAEGGRIQAVRPVFAGKALTTVSGARGPFLATLRPNVFPPEEAGLEPAIESLPVPVQPDAILAQVKELLAAATAKVPLTEASIIVSGGRGLKGPENFKLLEDLAAALGAGTTVGASRAAVDEGWRPHADQVGQTGKTVSPVLYIACGISGAIQHLAGMSSAKVIVAINKDPDAPIFKVADYGLVGDLFQVVPALTAAVRALER